MPVTIPPNSNSEINTSVGNSSIAILGWNISYSGSSIPLVSLSSGTIDIKYLNIIHNVNSKGPPFGGNGIGSIRLWVWLEYFTYRYIYINIYKL
jgi:hypothetical protein